jgi:hypothetical protein
MIYIDFSAHPLSECNDNTLGPEEVPLSLLLEVSRLVDGAEEAGNQLLG